MSFFKKALYVVFAFVLIQTASAQNFSLELATMMPLSGNNSLTGLGKGGSIGYQTDVSYNVRVRANFEVQFFQGSKNSLLSYGSHWDNWPQETIYEIKNTIINMRYSEISLGYDYFLFKMKPNMYIGPDLFVAQSTANYQRTSEYQNNQDVAIAFTAGLKVHYGIEKKVKKMTLFGEYTAAFAAHTPYIGIDPDAKLIRLGLNHQFGLGFRF
jgi:hypothetical protein